MGMFDNIVCEYKTDGLDPAKVWQTKDTPSQMLDNYRIDKDGQLWVEDYDVEDHSDPNASGIKSLAGMLTRVNERWNKCLYRGNIVFYDYDHDKNKLYGYSALFDKGVLINIEECNDFFKI